MYDNLIRVPKQLIIYKTRLHWSTEIMYAFFFRPHHYRHAGPYPWTTTEGAETKIHWKTTFAGPPRTYMRSSFDRIIIDISGRIICSDIRILGSRRNEPQRRGMETDRCIFFFDGIRMIMCKSGTLLISEYSPEGDYN